MCIPAPTPTFLILHNDTHAASCRAEVQNVKNPIAPHVRLKRHLHATVVHTVVNDAVPRSVRKRGNSAHFVASMVSNRRGRRRWTGGGGGGERETEGRQAEAKNQTGDREKIKAERGSK